jgi:hypothetical protein
MVNGGGCTGLVKMIGTGPPVGLELELLGRETPQTLMAVVVTGKARPLVNCVPFWWRRSGRYREYSHGGIVITDS